MNNYYIKQIGDKDCSLTCLKMLMATIYKNDAYLYYPEATDINSANLKRITQIAKKEGISLSAYRMQDKAEIFKEELANPLLITFKEEEGLHMVMLKTIMPNKVEIYDPKRCIYWLDKESFLAKWDGYLLEIVDAREPAVKFYNRPVEFIPRHLVGLTVVFQILSLLSLLFAMFFMDKNYSYLIPIILFICYLIFEFCYQLTIKQSLKRFDELRLHKDYVRCRSKFKDYYLTMEKFKSILISTPIKLVASIITIIFGVFILGINSLYNLGIIAILFSVQIVFKILDKKYLESNRSELENLERNLINSDNENEEKFIKNLECLNRKSYKLVGYLNLKKYILLFLTIALCIAYQSITGYVSLNFILFHIFLYSYLEENLDKILDMSDFITEYRYYKCLYTYYFK